MKEKLYTCLKHLEIKCCTQLWKLTFWHSSIPDTLGAIFISARFNMLLSLRDRVTQDTAKMWTLKEKKQGSKESLWQLDEWAGAMHHLKCNLRWGSLQPTREWAPPYRPENANDFFFSLLRSVIQKQKHNSIH